MEAPQTQERVRRSSNDQLSTFVNGVDKSTVLNHPGTFASQRACTAPPSGRRPEPFSPCARRMFRLHEDRVSDRTCRDSSGTPDGWHPWCERHRLVVEVPGVVSERGMNLRV